MAHEVVGAELVGGVFAVLYEVVGPFRHVGEVLSQVVEVAVLCGDDGCEREHVATLLYGHGAAAAVGGIAVVVAVGLRVVAQVVVREVVVPFAQCAVLEDRGNHGFGQCRGVDPVERLGGIGHVERVDEAAGVVLTAHKHEVALRVGEELVGSVDLPIDACQNLAVLGSAHFVAVHVDDAVCVAALLHDVVVVLIEVVEARGDGGSAVVRPVAFAVAVEVLDGERVVVAEHSEGAFALRVHDAEAIVVDDAVVRAAGAFPGADVAGDGALACKLAQHVVVLAELEVVARSLVVEDVDIAPVDEVAGLGEGVLRLVAGPEVLVSVDRLTSGCGGLACAAYGHLGTRLQEHAHGVELAVVGPCLIGDVGNGGGEEHEVAHHLRSGEDQVEVYAAALEGVVGAGGSDGARLLLRFFEYT